MSMTLCRPRKRGPIDKYDARIAELEQEIHRLKLMRIQDEPDAVLWSKCRGTVRKVKLVYAWVEIAGRIHTVPLEEIVIVSDRPEPEEPKKGGKK